MCMIVVLHGALLMVIPSMLLPLISNFYQYESLIWLACIKAKMLQKLCYWKSETVSRYPGFSERFWFSYLSSLHNGQDCFNIQKCDPMLMTKIFLKIDASDKGHFEVFPKEKEESSLCHALLWSYFLFHVMLCFGHAFMLCYTFPCFSWKNLYQRQKFSALQLIPHVLETKREIYYSLSLFTITIHPLLFMTLFTPNFCLFKRGCPLYLKQVLLQVFFSRESSF